MTRLNQRRIVITGAGSGLGRATALRFAHEGWRVAIADINDEGMAETQAAVEAAGGSGLMQRCDITVEADWTTLAERLQSQWDGVDVLINNAGIAAAGSVVDSRMADWQRLIDINLMGVVKGCRAFTPMLLAQGEGHIVNIASFAGIACPPGMAAYNVVKAGVIALSESLRAEIVDEGVDVSVVCPAFFPTNLVSSMEGGDPVAKKFTELAMKHSGVTAEDVAAQIYSALQQRRFMVITHRDSRLQWRIKRAAPETFYKLVRQRIRQSMARIAKRQG